MSVTRSVAVGFAGALTVTAAIAADSGPSKELPPTKLKFFEIGGDSQKGAHGTFLKMPAGFVIGRSSRACNFPQII